MVSSTPGGGLQGADDGDVEASPPRPRPAPDEKPSKSVVDTAVIKHLVLSVGELSGEAGLEASEALCTLFFPTLPFFASHWARLSAP
jgi:hypothetical protein